MLLTLIKTRETRYGIYAVLIETNHIFGDKHLADLYIPLDEVPLELIYRVSIPRSGMCLYGKHAPWLWPNRVIRKAVENYLRSIQSSGEEIRLEITNYDQI
jgi:hypothetical protein